MPERIQLRRTKGWRMPPNTVKVDRRSKWGNPFTIQGAREAGYKGTDAELARMCVGEFRERQYELQALVPSRFANEMAELRGKNLACWCALDQPCHADVLLELANKDQP